LLAVASVGLVLMGAYQGGAVDGGGKIAGTVKLRGKAPALKAHKVTNPAQHAACGQSVANEEVATGGGGTLANAVVWIEGITKGAPTKAKNVTLDQVRCNYSPRVLAATKGSRLTLTSSDDTLHNVHGYLGERTIFNLAIPVKGMRIVRPLNQVGVLHVKCDAGHTWMSAYVHVFEHPYFAVTRNNGRFELSDVPPGSYRVKAWHERLGTQTGQVQVAAGGTATWDVNFPAR